MLCTWCRFFCVFVPLFVVVRSFPPLLIMAAGRSRANGVDACFGLETVFAVCSPPLAPRIDFEVDLPRLLAHPVVADLHTPPPPPRAPVPFFARDTTQFLCCMEMLLGTAGAAPPTLVDGAAAGLGAVLGEMHREGLFAAASPAEVSLPL